LIGERGWDFEPIPLLRKEQRRLSVLICEARRCSHLKRAGDEYLCRFLSGKDRMVRKRMKKKGDKG